MGEEGRKGKLICSRRCKDRRYARLHPEALRAKQRRKYARRRVCVAIRSAGSCRPEAT